MRRLSVAIPINVPLNVVRRFVKELADDESLAQAYYKLRGTPSPSRVVEATQQRVTIYEPTFDPSIKAHGLLQTGWTVSYDLQPQSPGKTFIEVGIEYNRLTAMMGMGLIKVQAQNELIHRVSALLAFERGYHAERNASEGAKQLPEAEHTKPHVAPSDTRASAEQPRT